MIEDDFEIGQLVYFVGTSGFISPHIGIIRQRKANKFVVEWFKKDLVRNWAYLPKNLKAVDND